MSDLAADYARAGFGGHLPFGERPAVLVADADALALPGDGPA